MTSRLERFTTEKFLTSDTPSVGQLEELASVWRQSATERHALKDCSAGAAELYSRDSMEVLVEMNGDLAMLQHIIGVEMGRLHTVDDEYRTINMLRYRDLIRVQGSNVIASAALRYTFMWTDERVIRARRELSPINSMSQAESLASFKHTVQSIDSRIGISLREDVVGELAADVEFSEVTDKDCAALTVEAMENFAQFDAIHRRSAL